MRADAESSVADETSASGAADELPPLPSPALSIPALAPRQPPSAEATAPPLPRQIDGYEIVRQLGRGGMGVVYQARQQGLDRLVALKLIAAGAFSEESQDRFRQEAEALAQLRHANIVQVYDVGRHEGQPYISLEFVEGGNLADRMDGAPLPARDAAEIVRTLALAMEQAHRRGVIHRDLKPENVLLTSDGVPKIADFGLAKRTDQDSGRTRTGAVLGTPSYMAPEQAAGRTSEIDARTDVYALGAILYELLTGRPPHRGESPVATLRQVLDAEPAAVRLLNPAVPRDLETICAKCLAKPPERRYATAGQLAEDLQRWREGRPIRARRVTRVERAWRWCRRNPTTAALTTLLLLVMAASGVAAAVYQSRVNSMQREAETQRQVGRAQQYYQLLEDGREVARRRQPGWRQQSLDKLRQAARLDTSVRDPARLRSDAITYLTSVDFQQSAVVQLDDNTSKLAFRPGSAQLAVTRWHTFDITGLWLLDVPSRRIAGTRPIAFGLGKAARDALKGGKWAGEGFHALAYSGDGKLLAAGSRGGEIRIWDESQSPPQLAKWRAHKNQIWGLEFSPDGKELFSCSIDNTLAKWAVPAPGAGEAKELARTPLGAAGHALSLGYGAGGELIVACGWEAWTTGHVRFFRAADLAPIPSPPALQLPASAVAFAPDRRRLAVAGLSRITLADMENGRVVRTFQDPALAHAHERQIAHLAFDPTGTLLVSGGTQDNSKVWDATSGRLLATLPTFGRSPRFSPDGRILAAAGGNRVALYDVRGLLESHAVAHQRGLIKAFDVSDDGGLVACLAGETNELFVPERRELTLWDAANGRRLNRVPLPTEFPSGHDYAAVAIAPGGRHVACLGVQSVLHLFDRDAGALSDAPTAWLRALAFSPDERLWLGAGADADALNEAGGVTGCTVPDMAVVSQWHNVGETASGPGSIVCLAAGSRWVVAGSSGTQLHLFEARTGAHQDEVEMEMGAAVRAAALHPNETLVAAGNDEGVVRLFSIPGGNALAEVKGHSNRVTSLAFSPDGGLLASAGKDGDLRLWGVGSGELREIFTRRFENGQVIQLKFAPDGKRLYFLVRGESALRVWQLDRLRDALAALGLDW